MAQGNDVTRIAFLEPKADKEMHEYSESLWSEVGYLKDASGFPQAGPAHAQ